MQWGYIFFLNSVLLGIGLAMDCFSLSLVNGLNEPKMKPSKMCFIALVFGFFQALMPLIGWVCVHTVVEKFKVFEKFVPWIALILLSYIGGKMLYEGLHKGDGDEESPAVTLGDLLIQGIATAIDALSVGFTIADLHVVQASVESVIIGTMTFIISIAGLLIGRKFGTALSGKSSIFGGIILIGIGLEIFIKGLFF